MNRAMPLALAALSCLAGGCGPIIIAVPPPVPVPSELIAADKGEVQVDVGLATFPELTRNFVQGPYNGAMEIGLTDSTQLGLGMSFNGWMNAWLPTLSVGHTLRDNGRHRLGLEFETGLTSKDSYYVESVPLVDDSGEPVLDETGQQVYQDITVNYGYYSGYLAAGVSGQRALKPWLDLVYMGRASRARTFNIYGLEESDIARSLWLDATVGLVAHPVEDLRVGLSITNLASPSEGLPYLPGLAASVGYTFGAAE